MPNTQMKSIDAIRTNRDVRGMLRDIGYVLWISKKLAAEIQEENCQLRRPEMSDFCAVDALAF